MDDKTDKGHVNKEEGKPEIKRIVRIMATDVDGNLNVKRALRKVKGISFMLSNSICKISAVDPNKKIGLLVVDEIKKLEDTVNELPVPKWLLNRRMDAETGKDLHIIGAALDLRKREDVNLLRRIRAYKGIRHEQGQPVRGQRTRSTFRVNKSVGVSKKAAKQAKGGK